LLRSGTPGSQRRPRRGTCRRPGCEGAEPPSARPRPRPPAICADPLDVLLGQRRAGNQGRSDPELRGRLASSHLLGEGHQVGEDPLVRLAGEAGVALGIDLLEIVEDEIGAPAERQQIRARAQPAGVEGGPQPQCPAALQEGRHEPGEQRGIPARDGHAATRGLEVAPVLGHLAHQLVEGPARPPLLDGAGGAPLDAVPADRAPVAVDLDLVARAQDRLLGAGRVAFSRADAPRPVPDHLRARRDPLRVVAPATLEAAPLHEHGRPEPGSVLGRHPLDVEDRELRAGRLGGAIRAHGRLLVEGLLARARAGRGSAWR
jgi:hypothetical protein